MMKESKIRVVIPLFLALVCGVLLSDADLFHNFGTRFNLVQYNIKLVWLFFIGDVGQTVFGFGCSLIFYTAWRKNRHRGSWYVDLFWQLAALIFCWVILSILSLISNFSSYLWIQGIVRLYVFVTVFYVFNTLYRVRKMLYYPETRDEAVKKAQKFDELIDLLKKQDGK